MAKTSFYRGNLKAADIIGAATVALTQNEYTKIGEVVVQADQLIGMGYGSGENQDNASGRIYVDLINNAQTPAAINGKFRIMMQSSQDMPIGSVPVILDVDLDILRSGSGDRSGQIPWHFNDILLSKDKKFVFYVKCDDASQTLSLANSTVNIDITQQLV